MPRRTVQEVRLELEKLLKSEGITIKYKDESPFMVALSKILFFNKRFMSSYTTTIGNTIYVPNRQYPLVNASKYVHILFHELVHVSDSRKDGLVRFCLQYLMPQSLSLLALLSVFAFVSPYFLLFLLALLFLLPAASPWRTRYEARAYAMSILFYWWYYKMPVRDDKGWLTRSYPRIVENFTGWSYYRMCPSKDKVHQEIQKILRLRNDIDALEEEIPLAKDLFEIAFWTPRQ